MGVTVDEVGVDIVDQRFDGSEAAGADHVGGEIGEEAFDQIETHDDDVGVKCMVARMAASRFHLRMLLGGVVVGDQNASRGCLAVWRSIFLRETQTTDVSVTRFGAR